MALSADSIRIFGSGSIYVAPAGTPLPTHLTATLNAAFKDLGYTTNDGVKFTDTKDIGQVDVWQERYPAKRFINSRSADAAFTMVEWERQQFDLAFGGGTWTTPFAGEYRYTPPAAEFLDYRAMVIRLNDDEGYNWQIIIPTGLVTSNVEANFVSTGPATLPITFSALASGTEEPWTWDSDSPSLAASFS